MVTTGVIAATTIPLLDKIDLWGFVNLDIDGVLRSWFVKIYLISIIHQPMFQSS